MADTEMQQQQALFAGLVYNEQGQPAEVVQIGGVAHYAILDDGFRRHVEAYRVDNAILAQIKEQIIPMQDELVRGMMQMMGQDDLFTKAAIDSSIQNLEQNVRRSNPTQWVPWLRLLGFRVVVNVHGDVVQMVYPSAPAEGD